MNIFKIHFCAIQQKKYDIARVALRERHVNVNTGSIVVAVLCTSLVSVVSASDLYPPFDHYLDQVESAARSKSSLGENESRRRCGSP